MVMHTKPDKGSMHCLHACDQCIVLAMIYGFRMYSYGVVTHANIAAAKAETP